MRALILFLALAPAAHAAVPQEVVQRLRELVRAEIESQMAAKTGAQCSEEEVFESADRKLALLEQSLGLAYSDKADKYGNLISMFKEKMIRKCCEVSGKGGGRGMGRGMGGGGGGGGGGRRRGGG